MVLVTPCLVFGAVGSGFLGPWIFSRLIAVPLFSVASATQVFLFRKDDFFRVSWVLATGAGWLVGGIFGVILPDYFRLDFISPTSLVLYYSIAGLSVALLQWTVIKSKSNNSWLWIPITSFSIVVMPGTADLFGNIIAPLISRVALDPPAEYIFLYAIREIQSLIAILLYATLSGLAFKAIFVRHLSEAG